MLYPVILAVCRLLLLSRENKVSGPLTRRRLPAIGVVRAEKARASGRHAIVHESFGCVTGCCSRIPRDSCAMVSLGTETETGETGSTARQPDNPASRIAKRLTGIPKKNAPDRIRTCDLRFRRPLSPQRRETTPDNAGRVSPLAMRGFGYSDRMDIRSRLEPKRQLSGDVVATDYAADAVQVHEG